MSNLKDTINDNPPSYDTLCTNKILNDDDMKEIIKLAFIASPIDKICKFAKDKNIKIDVSSIPQSVLIDIVNNDNNIEFGQLAAATNISDLLQVKLVDTKLFLMLYKNIYEKKRPWKIVSDFLPDLIKLNFKHNGELSKLWCKDDSLAHAIFWANEIDIMLKIIKYDQKLLLEKNEYGFTPIHFLVFGARYYDIPNLDKHKEIINLIDNKIFLKVVNTKLLAKYTRPDITIEKGTSFVELMQILYDKSDSNRKKNIKIIIDCITAKFLN